MKLFSLCTVSIQGVFRGSVRDLQVIAGVLSGFHKMFTGVLQGFLIPEEPCKRRDQGVMFVVAGLLKV